MSLPTPHESMLQTWAHRRAGAQFTDKPNHPAYLSHTRFRLDPERLVHPNEPPISDKIYSGFLEHLGRCIYGGIVDDPKRPSPAKLLDKQDKGGHTQGRLGHRKDVAACIGRDGDLEVPLLRWPGGNFVSNYHWQDGIGPVSQRRKRIELAWLSDESNMFGTDEFIDYCRATGCEPYICLNMGTGTYEEALAWLEYCNGTGDTHWANLRRKHTGRDEPHNVKYWGLGNEMWGPWQVGNMTQTEYATVAKRWAHGLRLVDPSICLISCGNTGASDWDREVIQALLPWADMHSIHFYTMLNYDQHSSVPGLAYEKNVFGAAAAEKHIEVCKALIDMANIDRSLQQIPARDMKIAFDEWNVWDELKATGASGLEQHYDYTDMLGFCAWLNVLVRKHKDLGMACLAQSVNVISPLMTSPDGILKQTTYYPLRLFSRYMKNGHLLQLPNMPDAYEGPTYPMYIQQRAYHPAYIDMVAVLVKEGGRASIRLSVLNRHPEADWELECQLDGLKLKEVEVHEIYSDDLDAINTFEKPDTVVPSTQTVSGKEWSGWTVRKHSWAFFIFDGELALTNGTTNGHSHRLNGYH